MLYSRRFLAKKMSVSSKVSPITFIPHYFPRPWGGRGFESFLGRKLPQDGLNYGESWELTDRAEAQSLVSSGDYAGKTLNELWRENRAEVFGASFLRHPSTRFPLLLKILDAQRPLSVQVHPCDETASRLGAEAKNEWWYVLESSPEAQLYAGFCQKALKQEPQIYQDKRILSQLITFQPCVGDSFLIPGGTVHALGAGMMVFEVQQNSDTCYRLYDWERVDEAGRSRDLHWKEALEVIHTKQEVKQYSKSHFQKHDLQYFRLQRSELNVDENEEVPYGNQFAVGMVAEGAVLVGGVEFKKGDLFLVPANFPKELRKVSSLLSKTSVVWVSLT